MKKWTAKNAVLFISLTICLSLSRTCFSQRNVNQYNPYVSNSEIWKLLEFGINLKEKPYDDISFQENIRKSHELKVSNKIKTQELIYV